MHFVKRFVVLAAAIALASVMPGVNGRAEGGPPEHRSRNNCDNYIGDCFQHGCAPAFSNVSDTIGTCTAGTYYGCPCDKCDGGTGSCSANGCKGVEDVCTAGTYEGCPCD